MALYGYHTAVDRYKHYNDLLLYGVALVLLQPYMGCSSTCFVYSCATRDTACIQHEYIIPGVGDDVLMLYS